MHGVVYSGTEIGKEPFNFIRSDLTEILAGQTINIPVSFTVLSPAFYNMPFFYTIQIEVISSGPKVSVKKGLTVNLGPNCTGQAPYKSVNNIVFEKIGQNQIISSTFTSSSNSHSLEITMDFGGSDIDLHIYDQSDNHVGKNYSTGQIDTEIPGSYYYGDSTNSELIYLPSTSNDLYRIEAFGVTLTDSERVTIDVIETYSVPPLLSTISDTIFIDLSPADTIIYMGFLFDESEQNEIEITACTLSPLLDSLNDTLPETFTSITYPNRILVDSVGEYYLTVELPAGISYGDYSGTVTFTTNAGNLSIPISLDIKYLMAFCCIDIRGNVDDISGTGGPIDVSDLTYLVAYLFQGGPPPPCIEAGNVDGIVSSGGPIDVSDLTYLVAYLFQGGSAPPACG